MIKFKRTVLVGLVLALLVPSVGPVVAQQGGSGLNISPTRNELSIERGKSGVVKISIRNVSGVDITAKAEVNDFESDGVTGEPKILPKSEKPLPTSIRNLLSSVEDVPLAKDQKKDLQIPVNIPADATPGAYYGVVRYTAIPVVQQKEEGQVALSASVGTLVLIEIPGQIKQQIQLSSLKLQAGKSSGSFFLQPPQKSLLSIKNLGNGFSRPVGKIGISGMGGKEIGSYNVNDVNPKGVVLPNTSRTFTNEIKKISTPGKYTVTASVAYGNGGEVVNSSVSFWYIPAWLLVVAGVLLLALVVGIYIIYRTKFATSRRR